MRDLCNETVTALLTHPSMKEVEGVHDTALSIKKVVTFWKILNVKSLEEDVRRNDPLQAVISDPEDPRLKTITEFGDMCKKMISQPGKRIKQLTRDNALAIYQTCNGLVELSMHLLSTTHQYVVLGKFTTDKLEKSFSKLRQGCGGTYFITVQQILEKLNIQHAKLLLRHTNMEHLPLEAGHMCPQYSNTLDEEGSEVFDNIVELESSLTIETKMALVYIAGYVTRKDKELSEIDMMEVTTFYYKKYGSYTDELDRGQLNIPTDCACQWTFFSYIIFYTIKKNVCRKSLSQILVMIAERYSFNMSSDHARILSNIFIKNYCNECSPHSSKEVNLKILQLT